MDGDWIMEIYKYKDYEEYKKKQIEANVRKLDRTWVDPASLKNVMKYIQDNCNVTPKTILCHGTRRGLEQEYILDYFKDIKDLEVIGTEISHTATQFPNTIEWDCHDVKDEWVGNVDIIYSNSFDHSIKPKECLDTWMSCLKENGICVIEYSTHTDHKMCETDPFAATLHEYRDLIQEKYEIVEVINNKNIQDKAHSVLQGKRYYFVIRKKV